MVPITEQVVDGYVALVKELNWKRVAIISYDDDFNTRVCLMFYIVLAIASPVANITKINFICAYNYAYIKLAHAY